MMSFPVTSCALEFQKNYLKNVIWFLKAQFQIPHSDDVIGSFAVIGSCIAAIGVAACPARFRTVFPPNATFVSTFCGKQETHRQSWDSVLSDGIMKGGVHLPLV